MGDAVEDLSREVTNKIDSVSKVIDVCKKGKEILESIWKEIGLNEEQKLMRNERFFDLIANLVNDMVTEEKDLKSQIEQRVVDFTSKINVLTEELGLPKFQVNTELSLIVTETELRSKVDALNKEKHERLKILTAKRSEEMKMCQRLALEQLEMNFVGCPTTQQLNELTQNIKFLEAETEKRFALFKKHQKAIRQLWTELEVDPYTDFEISLCSEEADHDFCLSSENLEKLKSLESQLEADHRQLVGEISGLRAKVKALWDRLEVVEDERKKFSNQHVDMCPKTANALKNELARLEELKRKHMEKFVVNLRKELDSLWNKCYYSVEQRHDFAPYYQDVYDDEALALHEHQVQIMNNFYNENKKIYKLIEKREASWQNKMDFENKSSNSDRLFTARGGALLKEAKIRAAFEKGLPKIEEELKKLLKDWEKDSETFFLYDGTRYLDRIVSQHAEWEELKEKKKQERNRVKLENTKQEMVFGSKPSATKRKAIGTPLRTGTPSRSPKRGRLDATHNNTRFVHSSIVNTPRKTPGSEKRTPGLKQVKNKSKIVASSTKRRSNRLRQARANQRNNVTYHHPSPAKRKLMESKTTIVLRDSLVNKENSQAANVGSYQEFSIGIKSPNCRSSFVTRSPTASFHI